MIHEDHKGKKMPSKEEGAMKKEMADHGKSKPEGKKHKKRMSSDGFMLE